MVFRKFRPGKQWGVYDTRQFKKKLLRQNKRYLQPFEVPKAVQVLGVPVYDPNTTNFSKWNESQNHLSHPTFDIPKHEDHLLYKDIKCLLFDGTNSFTDGIDQACSLSKAVKRIGFPDVFFKTASKMKLSNDFESHLRDCIMQGECYDPTLEKLPRFHDPVLFWTNYYPFRVHGTPLINRGNTVLDNLFRTVHLIACQHDLLSDLRYDRDEPISGKINLVGNEVINRPLVLRFQPRLIIQSTTALNPWIKSSTLHGMQVPDITPINPFIDLKLENVYNEEAVLPRADKNLFIDTVMWCHVQNQKYPWTIEELGANAVMNCFCAALAQATRHGVCDTESLESNPVVTRAVQLTNGRLDLVVFQLNTLNLSSQNPVKNIVWIEPGQPLYKPGKFTENYNSVMDLNIDTFRKFLALLLVR